MNTRLISVTPNAEKTILYCARVSNPLGQDSENTKLLDYCIKHAHWSIFEMAHMTVEIKTSRAISAQILRHKSFSFQEFSQRYSEAQDFDFYQARRQDTKNRQNSTDDLPEAIENWFLDAQSQVTLLANKLYQEALEKGIAKESARFLLPMLTQTKVYMSGSLRSWLHYLDLRCEVGTQLEHREIADGIKQIFCEQFPIIAKAKGWL
jgi:thymidylate synthase (FAD)